jgi:membrane peptidoglycan carboxypeptidase
MQTSLNRRAQRRRNGGRRNGGGNSVARGIVVSLPLFLFASFVAVSAIAFLGTVSAYGFFSRDLTDPKSLEQLTFSQPSVIYDRTGKIQLASVGVEQRELVAYDQVAPVAIDATTAVEDKNFWTNTGFDPLAIVSAAIDSLRGDVRGASTITQQLVRQRLLDPALVQDPNRQVERKIKEIIQSVRLTQAYPGDVGKQQIITTYLNQNYYGSQLYGIKAAARGYFGVSDLEKLTLAQAAVLAAIPKSPSAYDLRRNAVTLDDGTIVVPANTEVVQRRNFILELMKTRSVLTAGEYTPADYDAAKEEPVVLVPEATPRWIAPHFVWQVRDELTAILCGEAIESCTALETGGYKIITTIDVDMQKTAEKWVAASAIVPKAKDPKAAAKALGLTYAPWMQRLRGENVWNGALVAMDYTTGEILAYVGSADYYAAKSSKRFQPKYDVLSKGWRQPGSAWKPIHYSIGIDDGTFTAATSFMDVTTDFGGGYTPTDSDNVERGPVRLRGALQWSLNIPAVKAMYMNGVDKVFEMAQRMGVKFQGDAPTAGLSFGIGTEVVHPVDLANAYGTIANGGVYVPHVTVLKITDPAGKDVYTYSPPKGDQVISPQAAYIVTDILKGNTNPVVNPAWGKFQILDGKKRRPATLKTGTNDEARDLGAYGFIAPSKDDAKYPSLVVGVWNGNSDYTELGKIFSFDAPTYVWQGFLAEVTKGWPITDWKEPTGLVHAKVDAFSGMKPGPFSSRTVDEIFIKGTQPKQEDNTKIGVEVDSATGDLWQDGCTGPAETKGFLDFSKIEAAFPASWQKAIDNWAARAAKGAGVKGGPENTATGYYAKPYFTPYGKTWGAPFPPTKLCEPMPTETPGPPATPPGQGDCGHGQQPTCPPSTPSPTDTPLPIPAPTAIGGADRFAWFVFVPLLWPLIGALFRRRRRR